MHGTRGGLRSTAKFVAATGVTKMDEWKKKKKTRNEEEEEEEEEEEVEEAAHCSMLYTQQ